MTSESRYPTTRLDPKRRARALTRFAALLLGAAVGCQSQPVDASPVPGPDTAEPAPQHGTLIELREGRVQGRTDGDTRSFIGIPYAEPPVGPLRWQPPQPVRSWSDTRDGTGQGVACPQADLLVGPVTQSEDCLQLNVFAPAEPPAKPLSVLVWFHGGGNVRGSANVFIELHELLGAPRPPARVYDGAAFRAQGGPDVVVVTVNYRLGALGFLSHPGLTHEQGASGNYGLLDQRAALQWVKKHIRAFGGDPDRVTLFGQGSGATDTCYHLVAEGSRDLIHAAVLESGTCASVRLRELPQAEAAGEAVAAAVGCDEAHADDSVECLRELPVAELAALDYETVAGDRGGAGLAVIDGDFLVEQPGTAIPAGRFLHVPTILGSTSTEAAAHFAGAGKIESETQYRQLLGDVFGASAAEQVAAGYPVDAFASPNDAAIAVATDALFACPARRFAAQLSEKAPAYVYDFARSALVDPFYGLGPTHGVELLWVWNVWPALSPYIAEEAEVSGWLRGYWSALANGDFNGPGAGSPEWPRYSRDSNRELLIDVNGMTSIERSRDRCAVWEALPDAAPAMTDVLRDSLTTSL